MPPAVEALLRSPLLPDHLEQMTRLLKEERQRRRRFYAEITDEHKWEFINGEVIMHSPATNKHLQIKKMLEKILDTHVENHDLGIVAGEKAMCVFPRNDYEPDLCFFGREKAKLITDDTLKFPVPDFAVEILSPSTRRKDRGVKFEDYAAHGVREYWIIDPKAETVEQHLAVNGLYPKAAPRKSGTLRSTVVKGFEIPVRAIFDAKENRAVLKKMLVAG